MLFAKPWLETRTEDCNFCEVQSSMYTDIVLAGDIWDSPLLPRPFFPCGTTSVG